MRNLNQRKSAMRFTEGYFATLIICLTILIPTLIQCNQATAAIRSVAIDGEAAPGFAAGSVFGDFAGARIAINNSGQTVFTAKVKSGSTTYFTLWREDSGTAELIARSEENVPGISGDVLFSSFYHPNINDTGQVAFVGGLQGSDVEYGYATGVWKGTPGSLLLMARAGDTAPGSSGDTFGERFYGAIGYDVAFNNAGRVAFLNNLNGSTYQLSVWQENASGLTMLAKAVGAVPGFADATYNYFNSGIPLNNNGDLAFFPSITEYFDWYPWDVPRYTVQKAVNGSVMTKYTSYTKYTEDETAAPGVAGGTFQSFANAGQQFDMNASGQLVFWAALEPGGAVDSTNSSGIWSEASGSLALVARKGSQAPGTPAGAVFDQLGYRLVMNDSGQVAFMASLKSDVGGVDSTNNEGIWLETDGVLNLIARAGDRAPGTPDGVVFNTQINNYAINSVGQVYFYGTLTGPGIDNNNADGIWLYDPSNGLTLVVREGDEVTLTSGETVTFINIATGAAEYSSGGSDGRARYFNNNGEIAFGADVTPGSRGGFFISNLATNPPVPDIKANGQENSIIVAQGTPVSITISLTPGDKAGENADWWVAVSTPFSSPANWYSMEHSAGWKPGINRYDQAPLVVLSPLEVLNMALPLGNYTFYFAIDDPDGAPTGPWWGLDSVGVTVQ